MLESIISAVFVGLILKIFSPEIKRFAKLLRSKPIESLGLAGIVAILILLMVQVG